MKRTYIGIRAELLPIEIEGGFLACSVRVKKSVTVEPYHEYFDGTTAGANWDSDTKAFKIGFEEE